MIVGLPDTNRKSSRLRMHISPFLRHQQNIFRSHFRNEVRLDCNMQRPVLAERIGELVHAKADAHARQFAAPIPLPLKFKPGLIRLLRQRSNTTQRDTANHDEETYPLTTMSLRIT